MSPQEQRIAIAEACGWYKIHGAELYEWSWMHKDGRGCNELPSYLTDLNAMHEAEMIFECKDICDLNSLDRMSIYTSHLGRICVGHFGGKTRATASQRAEAFLKTIGKWKD